MSVVLLVTLLWVLFFGTHLGLASAPLRSRLVDRFGDRRFSILFSSVAAVSFTAMVVGYAAVRTEGPPGLALGTYPVVGWALTLVVGFGLVLMIAALWRYPKSNYVMPPAGVRPPHGLARITRHPFFVGVACLGFAHALLATKLVGAIFMTGLGIQAVLGALHQDRKLIASRGPVYAEFVRETSIVPFGAILRGRQRFVWGEMPWVAIGAATASVFALRAMHAGIFAAYGAPVVLATVGGAGFFLLRGLRAIDRSGVAPSSRVSLPLLFTLTGLVHAVVGFFVFASPLGEILHAGLVGSVATELTAAGPQPIYDRAAAFWFLFASPVLVLVGQVVRHAITHEDGRLLSLVARYSIGLAVFGLIFMPLSGFWAVLVLGLLVRKRAAEFPVATPALARVATSPL